MGLQENSCQNLDSEQAKKRENADQGHAGFGRLKVQEKAGPAVCTSRRKTQVRGIWANPNRRVTA
eukprot:CAMPEP_0117766846 /NCGR_PEP_ID=MMETSP0947-20121206/21190_1 /TAXON_ID=44440 /ORGANISM="Chattonella subsalsa, Strain CCMP2191" /LENGTH=64 /DNA_ID=CAMNT_0005590249 /DNA_START=233 /DNA_END=428 /DNA_ORIENTATION=+